MSARLEYPARVHIELARRLTGPEGAEAVAAAEALPDPDSLAAAEAMRAAVEPARAAAALPRAGRRAGARG